MSINSTLQNLKVFWATKHSRIVDYTLNNIYTSKFDLNIFCLINVLHYIPYFNTSLLNKYYILTISV